MPSTEKYIGYRDADRAQPWARFYDEKFAPLPLHVAAALEKGPLPAGTLPPPEAVAGLVSEKYADVETGYSIEKDGSLSVAVLTPMPRVSPAMWDWWFGWHGSRDDRYKLWHPLAHQSARWADGHGGDGAYIGRTSLIEEVIGQKMERGAIQFRPPGELGLPQAALSDKEKTVFICARIGHGGLPVDAGWLVHQVRATAGGAEMRSRFWLGGRHVALRGVGAVGRFFSENILQKVARLPGQQARDLLVHCSEEMNHLAAFLPEIHQEFNQKQ